MARPNSTPTPTRSVRRLALMMALLALLGVGAEALIGLRFRRLRRDGERNGLVLLSLLGQGRETGGGRKAGKNDAA